MNNKCIYLVIFDWSVYGDGGRKIRAFEKYANALEYFKELIDFEKEHSWIADVLKDDKVTNDYYFQEYINTDDTKECDCHWYVTSTYEHGMYSYIDLKAMPLQEYKEVNFMQNNRKIVINKCHGGFSLSEKAYEYLGLKWDGYGYAYSNYDKRTDQKLIECIEALGDKANGRWARLCVVEIPDDVEWQIDEYDGVEWVAEKHRTWG